VFYEEGNKMQNVIANKLNSAVLFHHHFSRPFFLPSAIIGMQRQQLRQSHDKVTAAVCRCTKRLIT